MISYVVRRLVTAVVVVIGVMAVTFLLLQIVYGPPGRAVLGQRARPAAVAQWNKENGYDRPLVEQFVTYVNQNVHGNFGYSYKLNQSVRALFAENVGRSAYLSGVSLVLAVLVAIPLGIAQAIKRNSVLDHVAGSVSFTLYSMPLFFTSLLLIEVFSLQLNILPSEASQATTTFGVVRDPLPMILPVVSLAIVSVASFSRYQRSSALDALALDYIKVARAKGLPERLVLTRHLIRNCCLPIITLIGLSLPDLIAGNLVTEQVYNYPGLGLLFFNSLQNEDYPVLLAYTLVGAVFVVLGNLVADVANSYADPRIRLA